MVNIKVLVLSFHEKPLIPVFKYTLELSSFRFHTYMKLGIWFSSSKTKFQFYKLDLDNAWLLLTQTEVEGLLPVNPSSSFFSSQNMYLSFGFKNQTQY
jgi:hypothetical protein